MQTATALGVGHLVRQNLSVRIVITGATGNVGSALLRRLVSTEHELVGVARRRPPEVAPYDRADWVQADLSTPASSTWLETALAGADAVVHLAWQIQPEHDREQLRRTNQGGTRRVIDAVRAERVPHLVHMSSVGAYGPGPSGPAEKKAWADEDWPTTGVPSSSYSVDKAAAERMVAAFAAELPAAPAAVPTRKTADRKAADPDTTVTVVRPALILQPAAASEIARYFLGPLVPMSLLHPALLRFLPWPRALALQFVHADDVAEALHLILERRPGGAFNLAAEPVLDRASARAAFGGLAPSVPLRALRTAATLTWKLHLQPTDAGWIDLGARAPLLRSERASTQLGWHPRHRGDDTLRQFVAALFERRAAASPPLQSR